MCPQINLPSPPVWQLEFRIALPIHWRGCPQPPHGDWLEHIRTIQRHGNGQKQVTPSLRPQALGLRMDQLLVPLG